MKETGTDLDALGHTVEPGAVSATTPQAHAAIAGHTLHAKP
ncbi:hypothetical protein [Streptomyces sp. NBC_01618]|nr:hypothetical protein OH735_32005 [Streptomyces sp. NBC_01618]